MSTITMGGSAKITREHLDRLAVVYVRQSTLAQVRDHGESTLRQYALAEDAERRGWPADRVLVIDADLGVSGRGGSARAGFKELVGRVCCGEVGAVFGLEVSRLARSSADLQRLLELCSLTDTRHPWPPAASPKTLRHFCIAALRMVMPFAVFVDGILCVLTRGSPLTGSGKSFTSRRCRGCTGRT
jgi:hypothetical protein